MVKLAITSITVKRALLLLLLLGTSSNASWLPDVFQARAQVPDLHSSHGNTM